MGRIKAAENIWTEGSQYSLLAPLQRTSVPAGKIEVMEVFSLHSNDDLIDLVKFLVRKESTRAEHHG